MKTRNTFLRLVILILAATLVTSSRSVAIVPEQGPSASGTGLFRFRNFDGRLDVWSFSFEVKANKNGRAHGRAQFDNLTAHTQVVVRINCLNIVTGHLSPRVVMTGTILHSDDPNLPKLQNVMFAASDGPLLPSFNADTITPPFHLPSLDGEPVSCRDTEPLTILDVEDGDIQVHLTSSAVSRTN